MLQEEDRFVCVFRQAQTVKRQTCSPEEIGFYIKGIIIICH